MYRILIVDDESIEREYLKSIFINHPSKYFVVGEACNGIQAIDKAIKEKPDIIIMDIYMPGCDGLIAAKKIKDQLNSIIILNTAYAEFDYAKQAVNLNLDSYLLKPAKEEDILITIEACVSKNYKQNCTSSYSGLLSVKDKEYPFPVVKRIINAILKHDPHTLQFSMVSLLHFLESRFNEIYEYKIYIINSVFSILMSIKEAFPENIYLLFDCEQYLQRIACPTHQRDIIDTLKELLRKTLIILESESIIKSNCSNMIQRYIDDNFEQNITLELLSEVFHYSPSYLSRTFHLERGITINSYLNKVRIEYSVQLLKTTDLAVKEIALNSGFINITHFNRIFKKVTGKTPTEIKKGGNL